MRKSHYNRVKGALGDLGMTSKELSETLEVGQVIEAKLTDKYPFK